MSDWTRACDGREACGSLYRVGKLSDAGITLGCAPCRGSHCIYIGTWNFKQGGAIVTRSMKKLGMQESRCTCIWHNLCLHRLHCMDDAHLVPNGRGHVG